MPKPVYVSTNPDDATEGGFLDGVRCKITSAKYIVFAYPGGAKATGAQLVLKPKEKLEGMKKSSYEQFYSAGGGVERFKPSKDGTRLVQATGSTATVMSKKSGLMKLFADLANAGAPKPWLGGPITNLTGLDVTTAARTSETFEAADGTKGGGKSWVGVAEIHNSPWSKGDEDESEDESDEDTDEAEDDTDEDESEEAEEESGDDDEEEDEDEDSDESESDDEVDALLASVSKYAKAVLKKKPLDPDSFVREMFKAAKLDKNRAKIMDVIEDKTILAKIPGITFDKKKKLLSVG